MGLSNSLIAFSVYPILKISWVEFKTHRVRNFGALFKDKFRKMFGYKGELCEVPVVDVTTANVDRELPEIMDAIGKADIVALDCVSNTKCSM